MDLHVTLLRRKEFRPVPSAKDLEMHMAATLNFDERIKSRVKRLLDTNNVLNVINFFFFSKLFYCSVSFWSSTTYRNINKIKHLENYAGRTITRSCKFDHITPVLR